MSNITGKSLVAGQWVAPDGRVFPSFNPYTGTPFNAFHECTEREVDDALRAAQRAWQHMRGLDGQTIGALLDAVADEIEALTRAHFRSLGMSLMETASAWWRGDEFINLLATMEGAEHVHRAVEQGRGAARRLVAGLGRRAGRGGRGGGGAAGGRRRRLGLSGK